MHNLKRYFFGVVWFCSLTSLNVQAQSGDSLLDNLLDLDKQVKELSRQHKYNEAWDLQSKITKRYGASIQKSLEQASETVVMRLKTINGEYAKFGRTLESTEPLRAAVTRYRAYADMAKFTETNVGAPRSHLLEIEEIQPNYDPKISRARLRILKGGSPIQVDGKDLELDSKMLDFMRKSEVLSQARFRPNTGNYVKGWSVVEPAVGSTVIPGAGIGSGQEPGALRSKGDGIQ
jgi:hypothetical protein